MATDSHKTFGQWQEELGAEVAARAEVLAAMDCLMHHLAPDESGDKDLEKWNNWAIPDDHNWNLLDWEPEEASIRTMNYMRLAKRIKPRAFEGICKTFVDMIRKQCFHEDFVEGRFQ